MTLTINGEERAFTSLSTLADLVTQLGMKPDRVAIELNRELVPRDRWPATQLSDRDRLEIVHFVGGGSDVCVTSARVFNTVVPTKRL
jgi:thiamine biosynthesis protein ThiS